MFIQRDNSDEENDVGQHLQIQASNPCRGQLSVVMNIWTIQVMYHVFQFNVTLFWHPRVERGCDEYLDIIYILIDAAVHEGACSIWYQ